MRATYFELAARLDATPGPDGYTGQAFRFATFANLYFDRNFPRLAEIWRALDTGNPVPVPESGVAGVPADNYLASQLHVICNDSDWPESVRTYQRDVATDRLRHPMFGAAGANITPCASWPSEPVEPPVKITDDGPSVGTSAPVRRRVLDLLAAGGVLFVSSFWWVALHAWWPGDKPYVGGSTDGSAWDLVFGYNGFGRVFGGDGNPSMGGGGLPGGMQMPAGGGFGGGSPGVTRMFDTSVGGQISWLLPLALLVMAVTAVAGVARMRARQPGNPAERAGWFLWGGWLVVTALVFSYAEGIWHPYYTTMLAPAIAAIAAAGLVRFWHAYRDSAFGWWLLPLAVTVTAGWAFVLATRDMAWHGWTCWAVLAVAVVAVGGMVAGRLGPGRLGRPALVVGLVAVLLVPAVWSTAAATVDQNGIVPAAGPSTDFGGGMPGGSLPGMPPGTSPFPGMGRPPAGMMSMVGGGLTDDQRRVLDYAEQNSDGTLRFVLSSSGMGFMGQLTGGGDHTRQRHAWVEQHCGKVDPGAYGGPSPEQGTGFMGAQTLYDCRS